MELNLWNLRWFGVGMWEDGWWCSAGTGFIKIKRALNLIYGICINTLSKKALLTSIPRFSVSLEEKMLIFHANAVLWEGAATNTCPLSSVFSIEMPHVAQISHCNISGYIWATWCNALHYFVFQISHLQAHSIFRILKRGNIYVIHEKSRVT